MKGISRLIAMRKAGKRPTSVWVNFDKPYAEPKFINEWHHLELEYAPDNDLRPFVDLDVILFADTWREEVGDLYAKLTKFARTITVLITDFGDDIGWWWDKELGRCDFGQRCYARELRDVHADATAAAVKGNKEAYAEAQAKEAEIIKSRNTATEGI